MGISAQGGAKHVIGPIATGMTGIQLGSDVCWFPVDAQVRLYKFQSIHMAQPSQHFSGSHFVSSA